MAGPSRGAYFPLELGDEVVCGFREGAVDEPIIIGALHSDQDPPPPDADTTESNNTRTILSREPSLVLGLGLTEYSTIGAAFGLL